MLVIFMRGNDYIPIIYVYKYIYIYFRVASHSLLISLEAAGILDCLSLFLAGMARPLSALTADELY
jgi:hypothetical protein